MKFELLHLSCFAFGCLVAGTSIPADGQLHVSYTQVVVQGEPTGTTIRPVFVTNVGDVPVTISRISIDNAPSNRHTFVATGTCSAGAMLPPQARCRVDAGLVSSGFEIPWSYSATLIIESDVEAPISVALIGQVCDPMDCDFLTRFLGDHVQPKYLDFPPQMVGGSVGPLSLMTFQYEGHVGNRFAASLQGGDADSFQIVGVHCSERADQPDCAFDLMFRPQRVGPLATQLVILGPSASVPAVFSIAGQGGIAPSPPPTQQVDINQHGLTGSWYNPATSGQGIQLEVYPNTVAPGTGFLQGGWFTYKDTGYWDYDWEQRWYSFSGNVLAGQASATLTIYQNVGGNFNAPPATSGTPVGAAVLSFQDCATATMQYAFTDGSDRSGVIPLIRLTPNVTCSTNGDILTSADFGYSGNWFDPVTSGQGFIFEVNPNAATVFFAWATYAPEGQSQGAAGQRWYVGQGSYFPGTPTAAVTLYETCCGSFNEVAATDTLLVGAATVTFHSCHSASLTFSFTGGTNAGASGTINLSRVGATPADCLP